MKQKIDSNKEFEDKLMIFLPKDEDDVRKWLLEFSKLYKENFNEYYKYLKIDQHAYAHYPCRQLSERIIIKSLQHVVNIVRNYKEEKKDSYIIYTEDIDFFEGQQKILKLLFNIIT